MKLIDFLDYAHGLQGSKPNSDGWAIACRDGKRMDYVRLEFMTILKDIRRDTTDRELIADIDDALAWVSEFNGKVAA